MKIFQLIFLIFILFGTLAILFSLPTYQEENINSHPDDVLTNFLSSYQSWLNSDRSESFLAKSDLSLPTVKSFAEKTQNDETNYITCSDAYFESFDISDLRVIGDFRAFATVEFDLENDSSKSYAFLDVIDDHWMVTSFSCQNFLKNTNPLDDLEEDEKDNEISEVESQ